MPSPAELSPLLFYRLGPTKEKGLFKRLRDTYDGIVVPAHIASYFETFCSEFVGTLGKPYFIDPMTYIFANDPAHLKRYVKDPKTGRTRRDPVSGRKRKGEIRRSYSKLVERDYQGVVADVVQAGRRLVPDDLADAAIRNDFVRRVVEFQVTHLSAIPQKYRKYEEYAARAGRPLRTVENRPMCVVAPYFPTTTVAQRGWHRTNVLLVKEAKRIAGDLPVYAVVLATPQVLAEGAERIAADCAGAGADGYLLWPDGFSGEQDLETLRVVYNAVTTFAAGGKPTILMYGGAFSLALHYAGLSGFACGICYGEHKLSTEDIDVEGTIRSRYYIRGLKKKVVIETEAKRLQIANYPDLVCHCAICERKPDPVDQGDGESREHFMLVRAGEIAQLRAGLAKAGFAASLDDAFERHRSDPLLQPIAHMHNWALLLRSTKDRLHGS